MPVLVVAWVFELTPEGLKRDAEVDHDRAFVADTAKRLDRIILVVLALALGYFAFDKFVLDPARDVELAEAARQEGRSEAIVGDFGDKSIAVLAFENMSSDQEQDYFAEGIAEEILNLLASIPELRVISRSSSFTYKGREVPVPQIARELNVAHVLEGSVRKSGNQVRVTAQLIAGRSDTHLWSRTWDRSLEDIFAIQDEVAADVVAGLKVQLSRSVPTSRRTDPEVTTLVLRARQILQSPDNRQIVANAGPLIKRALELDPDYVPAIELESWLDYLRMLIGELTKAEADAHWQAQRARLLELDPENSLVLSSDAWDLYDRDRDIESAAEAYQELLAMKPNDAEVLRIAGGFLRRIGFFEASIPVLERCTMVDPLKNGCIWQLKESYLWMGDLDNASRLSDTLRLVWNRPSLTHDALILLLQGQPRQAIAVVTSWGERNPTTHAYLAMAAHDLGDSDMTEREIDAFWNTPPPEDGPYDRSFEAALLYAYVGRPDDAFHWLDEAYAEDETQVFRQVFEPTFKKLHEDPRWQALRERLGISEARLNAITFDVPASFLKQ